MPRFIAFALIGFASLTLASAQQSSVTLRVGDPAPPIKVRKWIKGQPVTQLGRGKVNVVEFWATWCGPCKESIPHLNELAKKYKGKATFTGVSVYEVPKPKDESYMTKVAAFVKTMGSKMSYTVAADGKDGFMAKRWMEAAGEEGIPTAFVVDRQGKIAWIGHPMENLDAVVGKVIAGTYDTKAEAQKIRAEKDAQARREKVLRPIGEALQSKNYAAAVTSIDRLFADPSVLGKSTNPEATKALLNSLRMVRFAALTNYDEANAQKYAAELADGPFKNDAQLLNSVAWDMIEDKSPIKNLDTALAVRIAERAVELTDQAEPNILDTLALAYFRAGKVTEALDTQIKAVELARASKETDPSTLAEMKARLERYTKAKGL